jgi:hypothetical protein
VWANHYANTKPGVEETEAVDDEFDLDEVLRAAEEGDWVDILE